MIILWILAAGLAATVLHVCATALLGRAFGLQPKRLSFGAGPALLSGSVHGVDIRLGPIVLAGGVRFGDAALERLPLWKHIALALAGVGALLAAATLLMGPEALRLAQDAAATFVRLVLAPLQSETLLADALAGLDALPAASKIAAVLAVYAGVNLVPLAFHPAGTAIMAILSRYAGLAYNHGVGRIYLLASVAIYGWIAFHLALQAWRLAGQGALL